MFPRPLLLFATLLAFLLLSSSATALASRALPDTVAIAPAAAVRADVVSDPNPPPPPPPPVIVPEALVLATPTGQMPGDQLGNAVASAGDMNGDGYPDVIVGAWSGDEFSGDAGMAYVYFGGPGADGVPDLILHGQGFQDNFGTSVASAGDINGDGYGDVIVGAWRASASGSRSGRAYVFFGGPTPDAIPDLVLTGEALDDHFGISVACAGDLNGDGFSDVIVGAPGSDVAGADAGRAYVYFGAPIPNATPDLTLTGAQAGDHFGYSVSSAGDFNADGFPDFVVGAEQSGNGGAGKAYVFYGGPGLDLNPDLVLSGEDAGDSFGTSVASAGDLNGDGYVDLAVAAHHHASGTGRVYIFRGGPGADATPDLLLDGSPGDNFGQSVAGAGDVNGDGTADLIVGAWLNDTKAIDAGRAYIYYGGPAMDAVPDLAITGAAAGDRLGVSVAGVGDFNQDGMKDVVAGAYFNDAGAPDAGRAYIASRNSPQPPFVSAPAVASAVVGTGMSFVVGATDLNGDPIQSLTAAPLPAGATFLVASDFSSGVFRWTPGTGQIGEYFVTFTASNDLTGTATTRIIVGLPNRAPTLDPLANMTVMEGSTADQVAHATDPDGDALTFTLPGGPDFATILPINATSATLHVAPGIGSTGTYPANVRVDDGRGGSASASFTIVVTRLNHPPVLSGPGGIFASEGALISFAVTATDPDGDHVTLAALNRPVGSLFVDLGNNTGSFSWTPGFGQAGSYTVMFTGRDALGASASPLNLTIAVDDVNRQPTAAPGGPYAGVVNVPLTFNGTASSDPDGSILTYQWDFGDLFSATGATPSHSYGSGGTFTVVLTVSDGGLADHASTIATIQDVFPARAFTTSGYKTLRLGSGKATWCAEVEPIDGDFLTTAIITSSIVMKYGAAQIPAQSADVSVGTDKDMNGIQEVTLCFSKTDLRTLFAGLPKGTSTVTVTLDAPLNTGGRLRTTVTFDVVNGGGGLAASVSPNPLNPSGVLTFALSRPGSVDVSIFDLLGRRVRNLAHGLFLSAGYHDMPLDGRNDRGDTLPSGTYFYRVQSDEGVETGRFVILK